MPTTRFLKVVIVGDRAVGKTCLLARYLKHEFPKQYIPTIFRLYSTDVVVDGEPMKLSLFDTTGHGAYDRLRPLDYPDTDLFVLCFSIINRRSFENILTKWYPEIYHHSPGTPILLVGLGGDLRDNPNALSRLGEMNTPAITHPQALKLAQDIHAIKYVECSALAEVGVEDVFDAAITAASVTPQITQKSHGIKDKSQRHRGKQQRCWHKSQRSSSKKARCALM